LKRIIRYNRLIEKKSKYIKIFPQFTETDTSNTMVRLYGRLSVNGPVAVNRYRQKYGGDGGGGGGGGGGCEIIVTPNPIPGRLSVVVATSAPVADNTMKTPSPSPSPSPPLQPTHIAINEKQVRSLGKLIYTTKAGDTFTAYHSAVFPKIVNESDKIVYDNKERWYEAMRVVAPVRCD
jgi:hypothetical protein